LKLINSASITVEDDLYASKPSEEMKSTRLERCM